MNIEIALFAALLLYWGMVAVFLYGIRHPRDETGNPVRHRVSVVVAARNEERHLPACLASLAAQTYPPHLFEVIVVDDHSVDGTAGVCASMGPLFQRFRRIVPEPDPVLLGKTNALARGIDASDGEIVLITDADCTVPPTWVEAAVRRYRPGVGLVGGMTVQRVSGPFSGMQSLDWTFLLGIASAAVNLRNPLSTIGNNLSFRRAAYDDTGGYRAIRFSVTEDYALFQAIVREGHWDYFYPLDPSHVVVSEPCPGPGDLIRQKHRWGKGGLDMKPSGFAVMAIGFLAHVCILLGFLLGEIALAGSVFLAKALADYTFLHVVLHRIGRPSDIRHFYWFELYYFLYVLLLPFLVFFGGKVRWKGRAY